MSTLKVGGIRGVSASSDAITMADNGTCTGNITNNLSNRNLLINGACVISQEANGTAVDGATAEYAVDRTHVEGFVGGGTGTAQQVDDSPSGFTNSIKVTVTGTDTSLAATDYYVLRQIIEGYNVRHLGFGAAGGTSVTLSFFVKSSLTGNFSCSLGNGSNSRSYPIMYTINAANTWEKKTMTFPADDTGTWGTGNGRGFSVRWSMGAGSSRLGTAGAWGAGLFMGATGTTNLFATNGATFQITGMQLEAGNIATDFEHRRFTDELALCQRYFCQYTGDDGDSFVPAAMTDSSTYYMYFSFPVPMRISPSFTGNAKAIRFHCDANNSNDKDFNTAFLFNPPTTANPSSLYLGIDSSGSQGGLAGEMQGRQDGIIAKFNAEM